MPDALVVDDDPGFQDALVRLVRAEGFSVETAASLEEARGRLEEHLPDLALVDLNLPDGSGLDLMRLLSTRYGLRGIALSGYGMEDDLQKSREAGFEKHVTKPVSLQTLQAVLSETLGTEFA